MAPTDSRATLSDLSSEVEKTHKLYIESLERQVEIRDIRVSPYVTLNNTGNMLKEEALKHLKTASDGNEFSNNFARGYATAVIELFTKGMPLPR